MYFRFHQNNMQMNTFKNEWEAIRGMKGKLLEKKKKDKKNKKNRMSEIGNDRKHSETEQVLTSRMLIKRCSEWNNNVLLAAHCALQYILCTAY